MELQDRSRLYPNLAPAQGNLVIGNDGRLQYAPLPQSAPQAQLAPSAPMHPAYVPQLQVAQAPMLNQDALEAQRSMDCWGKWVRILSAAVLAVNIVAHVLWAVKLSEGLNGAAKCKFYLAARVFLFLLICVVCKLGIRAGKYKTSAAAKSFIKGLVVLGLVVVAAVGFGFARRKMWKKQMHHSKGKKEHTRADTNLLAGENSEETEAESNGIDSNEDANSDSGSDSDSDSGSDSDSDSGSDSDSDSGSESGSDSGSDSGSEVDESEVNEAGKPERSHEEGRHERGEGHHEGNHEEGHHERNHEEGGHGHKDHGENHREQDGQEGDGHHKHWKEGRKGGHGPPKCAIVGCAVFVVIYCAMMFMAFKLYKAAKRFEQLAGRGNVPIAPVMFQQPGYIPAVYGNIPMGAPVQQ